MTPARLTRLLRLARLRGDRLALATLETAGTSEHFRSRVDRSGDCWLWTAGTDGRGYGRVGNGERAHRTAWALANGPIPSGLSVLHRCDVPLCVRPAHLFLGTQADNMADMVSKGRHGRGYRLRSPRPLPSNRGAGNVAARLTEAQVRDIRRRHAAGETQTGLASELGVGLSTVHAVVRRTSWSHLDG